MPGPMPAHRMVRPCSCPASHLNSVFRNATIDGREVTLWVTNDRIAVSAPCPLLTQ
jgi:hypothetical protein